MFFIGRSFFSSTRLNSPRETFWQIITESRYNTKDGKSKQADILFDNNSGNFATQRCFYASLALRWEKTKNQDDYPFCLILSLSSSIALLVSPYRVYFSFKLKVQVKRDSRVPLYLRLETGDLGFAGASRLVGPVTGMLPYFISFFFTACSRVSASRQAPRGRLRQRRDRRKKRQRIWTVGRWVENQSSFHSPRKSQQVRLLTNHQD